MRRSVAQPRRRLQSPTADVAAFAGCRQLEGMLHQTRRSEHVTKIFAGRWRRRATHGERPAVGPPCVFCRVRCERSSEAEGPRHQGRVDQPARVDPHRGRESPDGKSETVDGRGRHAEHAAAQRHHARLDQDWHGDRRRGLPGQGRPEARQRPRHHVPGRPHAVHGIVGHRRAQGRPRSERESPSRRDSDDARAHCAPPHWPRRCCRSSCRRCVGQAPQEAYRAPRTPDGTPDLGGIWQANNTANWDLEAHAARQGPVLALGAAFSVPPGLGVVEGGEIPYLPEALEKQQGQPRRTG